MQFSDASAAANLPVVSLSHTFSSASPAGTALGRSRGIFQEGHLLETKPQCQNNSLNVSAALSPSPPWAFSIFPSWRLACSPARLGWRVGFIHRRGCVLWRQRCFVCVRGCMSGFMCLCRMKCRLPPLYASLEQTHLHSQRGWLLCKRRRRRGSPE